MSFVNPIAGGSVILVTAVGEAEGARGAAAALACEAADVDRSPLLIDVGGRSPRPTLLASSAAQAMEKRIAAHVPPARVAARGQVCHLAVAAEADELEVASAAVTIARGAAVAHLPPGHLHRLLEEPSGLRPTGVLLRADLEPDRALVGLVVRDLLGRGLDVGVLKSRLPWVAERRALFGALPPGAALSERLSRRLLGASTDRGIPAQVAEAAS